MTTSEDHTKRLRVVLNMGMVLVLILFMGILGFPTTSGTYVLSDVGKAILGTLVIVWLVSSVYVITDY